MLQRATANATGDRVRVTKSKSNFIRNTTCTRTNISIIINCQHIALHGCHFLILFVVLLTYVFSILLLCHLAYLHTQYLFYMGLLTQCIFYHHIQHESPSSFVHHHLPHLLPPSR